MGPVDDGRLDAVHDSIALCLCDKGGLLIIWSDALCAHWEGQ